MQDRIKPGKENITADITNAVVSAFAVPDDFKSIQGFGSGHINETFLAEFVDAGHSVRVILQRLRSSVFANPGQVAENTRTVTEYINSRAVAEPGHETWRGFRMYPARDGRAFFIDTEGNFWQAFSFIENTETFDVVTDCEAAYRAGRALGEFYRLTAGLEPSRLFCTLPDFHNTPVTVAQYEVLKIEPNMFPVSDGKKIEWCCGFIADRISRLGVLETARTQGTLPERVIHGDPKINNFLFDRDTGCCVSMVDFDTVMPGIIHYDFGDFLRSVCNPAGADIAEPARISFDIGLCEAAGAGFMKYAGAEMSPEERELLYDSVRIIACELGIRFFTDYLTGSTYFKTTYPGQNLDRALVQFKLCESIEEQEHAIRKVLARNV